MTAPRPPSPRSLQRTLYILMPLIVLLFILAAINLLSKPQTVVSIQPTSLPTTTATAAPPTLTPAAVSPTEPAQETAVLPRPTSQPTVTATPFPDSSGITLLGPPADSTLIQKNPIPFYWSWPHPLAESDFFVVYLRQEGEEVVLGSVAEPNLGQIYQLVATSPVWGEASWFVRLESRETAVFLQESPARPIQIVTNR
ncbi:MAG: hypothetical protein AAF614_29600 [Chloroflexota bacterium]